MLWPDPGKTSLGWWLVAIHVAIVLLVGGGICYSAIGMLHDLADEQGKARVQLAGVNLSQMLTTRLIHDTRVSFIRFAQIFSPLDSAFDPASIGLITGATSGGLPTISAGLRAIISESSQR